MAITTLQGPVTHYQHSTETSGFINEGRGQISTAQVLAFRVNNRPVTFKCPGGGSISNGDVVTVIGDDKAGTLRIWCMRNDTTGATFNASYIPAYVVGGLIVLFGVAVSSGVFFLGIPIAALGAWLIYGGWRTANANKLLAATRAMGPAPVAHAT